jgi:hypothetical protein
MRDKILFLCAHHTPEDYLEAMPEPNHGHHHDEDHIPPPDLPQHTEKRILGFRPLHVIIGGLVLIAILLIYLLLIARIGF